MTTAEGGALAIQVLAGLSLAACCGLRAFMPPFVVGLLTRLSAAGVLPIPAFELGSAFEWLSSTPALIVFGCATLAELSADKIPAIDHLLDLLQTVIRPLTGALVFAASLGHTSPLTASVVGLLAGGSVAGGVHLMKAKVRLLSTLGTGGIASPILSLVEDLFALVGSILAVVAAVLAALLIACGLFFTVLLLRKFVRRVGRIREDLSADVQDRSSQATS